jgi:hypothetical protein
VHYVEYNQRDLNGGSIFTFVGDDLVDLDTTRTPDDELGLGIIDALLDLQGSKASKDDLCGSEE